jgi:hypothetical protein
MGVPAMKMPYRRLGSPGLESSAFGLGCIGEALGALDVRLSAGQLAALADAVPPDAVAGGRYAAAQLAHMDSEKGAART